MTQVNLLPTDIKVEKQVRRMTGLVVAAGVAVVGLLFFIFILQAARLESAQEALSAEQAVNRGLSTEIAKLAPFQQLESAVSAQRALLTAVEVGEVRWSGILRDVSIVQPDQMYLSSFSGSVDPVGGPRSGPSLAGQIGSLQFSGTVLDHPTLARWLTRLEEVTGWVNSWVNSASRDPGTGHLTFNGSVDLTAEATIHGALQ
jgi:Tfp pilus assembly protein PilN